MDGEKTLSFLFASVSDMLDDDDDDVVADSSSSMIVALGADAFAAGVSLTRLGNSIAERRNKSDVVTFFKADLSGVGSGWGD